jgi:hypothetical protein
MIKHMPIGLVVQVLAETPKVIAAVQKGVPARFPQQVLDTVLQGLADSARRLEAMPAD